ncbi:hypothetical protein PR048_022942 [Dryococelus australis]|uniref:Uncharacterized protein n=1 Tax=Dryococelus australis TaxID=614101 RepID=A0ABQ9GSR1_9NEOP|nr:hypothetical protein PR048_022942 [Dryococelus australis]
MELPNTPALIPPRGDLTRRLIGRRAEASEVLPLLGTITSGLRLPPSSSCARGDHLPIGRSSEYELYSPQSCTSGFESPRRMSHIVLKVAKDVSRLLGVRVALSTKLQKRTRGFSGSTIDRSFETSTGQFHVKLKVEGWVFMFPEALSPPTPVNLLASHQCDPGSFPGRPHVGIIPDEAVGLGGFSRGSPVSPPFHSGAAPYLPQSPSSALKTSMLRATSSSRCVPEGLVVKTRGTNIPISQSTSTPSHKPFRSLTTVRAYTGYPVEEPSLSRPSPPQNTLSLVWIENNGITGDKVNRGSTPCGIAHTFSHVGIVSDDDAGRRDFSGISRFARSFIPAPLLTHLASPLSALKTPMPMICLGSPKPADCGSATP